MEYKIYTSLEGTRGYDGEVNLTLSVIREAPPIWLSDFAGGSGHIYDGYSTHTSKFCVVLDQDERRIELIFENGSRATLSPEFVRAFDPKDPLNQLQVVPLKAGQALRLSLANEPLSKHYLLAGSSWWRS